MRNPAALPVRSRSARDVDRDPARPLRTALPTVFLALLVLAVGAVISSLWVVALAGALVVLGLVQSARAAFERERQRREADEWLLTGAARQPAAALLDWRSRELCSPRMRATLAHGLRRIELQARGGVLPGPVPLNTRAIRCQLGLVHLLQERLKERDRTVSVRGMVLVDRLLTEPGSPLYSRVPDDELAQTLSETLAALDPATASMAA